MKKLRFLAVLLVAIMFFSGITVNAAESYFYDGKWNLHTSKEVSVILDGSKVNFDVPPLIVEDRTLVPARAVFEKAGATVSWDQKKQQVTIKNSEYTIKLIIDSNVGAVNGELVVMDVPAKIVTDTKGTARTLIPLRFISENLGYTVLWDGDSYTATVHTGEYKEEVPEIKDIPNSISEIENYVSGDKDIVKIYADNTASTPSVTLMANPNRVVLDFSKLALAIKDGATNTAGGIVSNVRYAYHTDMYTRVVIDLKNQAEYKLTTEKGCYKVVLTGSTYKNISYYNMGDYRIEFKQGTLSKVSYDDDEFIYTFMSSSKNLGEGVIKANDTYIDTIDITPTSKGTKITIQAKCQLDFEIKNSSANSTLYYSRTHLDDSSDIKLSKKAKNMLVVVDAGHGGSDPGALGKEGDIIDLQEKDVTLDVSLMVCDILENSGVDVVMTRDTDVYVGLVERADIANELESDLFVSVHINSFTSPEPKGSMVYYYVKPNQTKDDEAEEGGGVSDTVNQDKDDDSIAVGEILARNILTELVDKLDTNNRGLGDGSRFVVIKRTLMPSVIVEGAFISNPEEKELMKTTKFRQSMAEAIASGVITTLNAMVK